MSEEIRVYVADLAAYNNGFLHGVWIDATLELDDIQEQVSEMLKATPLDEVAEEYAIHDYEGLEYVHEVACFLEEHREVAGDVLSHFGDNLEDARKALEENYSGCYSSLADYAEELTDGTAEIPQHLANYIDYERMERDMEIGGEIFTVETGYQEVHIFWAH